MGFRDVLDRQECSLLDHFKETGVVEYNWRCHNLNIWKILLKFDMLSAINVNVNESTNYVTEK